MHRPLAMPELSGRQSTSDVRGKWRLRLGEKPSSRVLGTGALVSRGSWVKQSFGKVSKESPGLPFLSRSKMCWKEKNGVVAAAVVVGGVRLGTLTLR